MLGVPGGIAARSGYVYWTNTADNSAWRVPIGGGAAKKLASGPGAMPGLSGVAVTASEVFWTNYGGAVMRAPIGGGTASVVDIGTGAPSVTVDATNVYWLNNVNVGTGNVYQMPLAGGAKIALAPAYGAKQIAVDEANVYWNDWTQISQNAIGSVTTKKAISAAAASSSQGVAVFGGFIYWTGESLQTQAHVYQSPINSGSSAPVPATPLTPSENGPTFVTSDGVTAFFVTTDGIYRVPTSGGSATKIVSLSTEGGQVGGFAMDDDNLYWTIPQAETVRQMSR